MLSFYEPITLRMICRGERPGDAKEIRELSPKSTGKLSTTVRDNGGWYSKSGDPVVQEGIGAVAGGDGDQRDRLKPPGETVDDGQQVAEPASSR